MNGYLEGNRDPEMTVEITRQGIAKYAGASGDFNPLHVDEEYAQDVGHDSVIAMGMYTAGIAGTMMNQWLGVENITSYSVRFEEIAYPGETVTYQADVTESIEDGLTAEFTATKESGETILSGTVEASFLESN
jgi:acyl dehydratase